MYMGKRRNEVPPHIFCISDGAYMDMLTSKCSVCDSLPIFSGIRPVPGEQHQNWSAPGIRYRAAISGAELSNSRAVCIYLPCQPGIQPGRLGLILDGGSERLASKESFNQNTNAVSSCFIADHENQSMLITYVSFIRCISLKSQCQRTLRWGEIRLF